MIASDMLRWALLLLSSLAAFSGGAAAQSGLNDAAKAMIGTWEFSNADREKLCAITFRADPTSAGMRVEFERACAGLFPFVAEITSWSLAEHDFLRLMDAKGQPILEFSEVEGGIFEAPRPEVEAVGQLAREIMASAYPLEPPLEVEIKVGTNWCDVE